MLHSEAAAQVFHFEEPMCFGGLSAASTRTSGRGTGGWIQDKSAHCNV